MLTSSNLIILFVTLLYVNKFLSISQSFSYDFSGHFKNNTLRFDMMVPETLHVMAKYIYVNNASNVTIVEPVIS